MSGFHRISQSFDPLVVLVEEKSGDHQNNRDSSSEHHESPSSSCSDGVFQPGPQWTDVASRAENEVL